MKIKRVNYLKILGKVYEIRWLPGSKHQDILSDNAGRAFFRTQNIYLDTDSAEGELTDTFFHEFFEVVNNSLSLGLEHATITRLACATAALFFDNGMLFEEKPGPVQGEDSAIDKVAGMVIHHLEDPDGVQEEE